MSTVQCCRKSEIGKKENEVEAEKEEDQTRKGWRERHAQGLCTFLPFRLSRCTSGSPKLPPVNNTSSEREMMRRGFCPSMTSAASPTSPLVGSPPPCGRPSGWVLLLMMMASTSQQGGLVPTDLFDIGGPDDAARNAKRFERIWEEEKQRCENTPQKPSLNRSNFKFCKSTHTVDRFTQIKFWKLPMVLGLVLILGPK